MYCAYVRLMVVLINFPISSRQSSIS